jgi:hypothetical protein
MRIGDKVKITRYSFKSGIIRMINPNYYLVEDLMDKGNIHPYTAWVHKKNITLYLPKYSFNAWK